MLWRSLCMLQFYILLVIYTYLGITPHPENSVPVFNDLLMHFAGYTVAAISISFARPTWALWHRAAFLIIYSVAIEIAQHFNPPRTFSGADIVANSCGVLLGLAAIVLLLKYVPLFAKLLYWKTSKQQKFVNESN
ncbi:MAG TPA: VanZ family protein [Cellvibrio sp.]|nr:VanZ family protein [Cellvibrio sp.]